MHLFGISKEPLQKMDKLWVEMMHSYFGQRGSWVIQENQASWLVPKNLKSHKHFNDAHYNEHSLKQMQQ